MTKLVIDLLGWVGAAAYLVAYALVSMKKLEGDAPLFQGMNVLGGALLVVNSAYYQAWPSVALNVVWMGVAIFVLGRYAVSQRKRG